MCKAQREKLEILLLNLQWTGDQNLRVLGTAVETINNKVFHQCVQTNVIFRNLFLLRAQICTSSHLATILRPIIYVSWKILALI